MDSRELAGRCWPVTEVGACVAALLQGASLSDLEVVMTDGFEGEIGPAIEWHAKRLGCEAETIETSFGDLERTLRTAHPALLKMGEAGLLAVVRGGRQTLRILPPTLVTERVALRDVCGALRNAEDQPSRPDYKRLVSETAIPTDKRGEIVELLLAEQMGGRRFDKGWSLRLSPGAGAARWLRQAGTRRDAAGLIAAHTAQYILLLGAWAVLGRLSFEGRLDHSWLIVWAFLLLSLVPLRVLSTWLQGRLVVGVGTILKRRLLFGSLRLEPDEVRHQGVGSFLGQALEAEAVETLALSGGIAGLLAMVELVVSGFLLGGYAVLLFLWFLVAAALAWRFLQGHGLWTEARMRVTQDLIESMVGHRTRLAQQRRDLWHESEDKALHAYFEASRRMDGTATSLVALIPRGWLLLGLACLAPAMTRGSFSEARVGVFLGGLLLAYNAFKRLTASFAEVAAAIVAWQRIAPLFHAAARPEHLPSVPNGKKERESSAAVIEAEGLTYSYRRGGEPVLNAGGLAIWRGDRILLEGSSGGGKSTFASLLAGLRKPDSGVLLLNGVDRQSWGDDHWRKQVVAAPQFHENHVLTETLAFNVLMGRGWPPTAEDMAEAEAICRELGLGNLIDRMPAGMVQMVGEGGWQLSHGERSRVYVARAILQNADLVILDESFGALDPENLKSALECTLRHAETLLVIAHP